MLSGLSCVSQTWVSCRSTTLIEKAQAKISCILKQTCFSFYKLMTHESHLNYWNAVWICFCLYFTDTIRTLSSIGGAAFVSRLTNLIFVLTYSEFTPHLLGKNPTKRLKIDAFTGVSASWGYVVTSPNLILFDKYKLKGVGMYATK